MTTKPSFQIRDVLISGWNYCSTEHRNVLICKHHQFEVLTDPNAKYLFTNEKLFSVEICAVTQIVMIPIPEHFIINHSIEFFRRQLDRLSFECFFSAKKRRNFED